MDTELARLINILTNNKWLIILVACTFLFMGFIYGNISPPIYKADALVQVEAKNAGLPTLSLDMASLLSSESSTSTEIEIIKSRLILGKTVDKLGLTTIVSESDFYNTIYGKIIYFFDNRKKNSIEGLYFNRFDENSREKYYLRIKDNKKGIYQLLNKDKELLYEGYLKEKIKSSEYEFGVLSIDGENNHEFVINKITRLDAIEKIIRQLNVSELGKQTGILRLTYQGTDAGKVSEILEDILQNYRIQNINLNTAAAQKSLVFLKEQLPSIKQQLADSEDKLNQFRQQNESVDLDLEAKSTLDTIVEIEKKLNDFKFEESDISQKFTTNHPSYAALIKKRNILFNKKKELNKQVEELPQTQREILRLMRDVEVNQQIYVQLLNKIQELNLVKASSLGNVRIIDGAKFYLDPVKPKKKIILILSGILGLIVGFIIAVIKSFYFHGIKEAQELEAKGLTVLATVPLSKENFFISKIKKRNSNGKSVQPLLAISNPANLTIEAIRSLRTSLHFCGIEQNKCRIITISGPTPEIGKSFISSNLAAVMASGGQKVLLIDGDLRKGTIAKHLSVSSQLGLSDYLNGSASQDEIIKASSINELHVITNGSRTEKAAELLMREEFKLLLNKLIDNYDVILIDTPPLLMVTDAVILSKLASITILVARYQKTTIREIEMSTNLLSQSAINVSGVVLNGVTGTDANRYYYQ